MLIITGIINFSRCNYLICSLGKLVLIDVHVVRLLQKPAMVGPYCVTVAHAYSDYVVVFLINHLYTRLILDSC